MIDWIIISLSLVVFIFYIITLFSLFEVKIRVTGKISVAFTYFITAIFFAIVIRILNLLSKSYIFSVPYLHEIMVVIMSFFLLMTALSFYSVLKSVTDRDRKRRIKTKTETKDSAIRRKGKKGYVRYKSRLAKNLFQTKAEKKIAFKRLRKQHAKTTKHRLELKKLMGELGEGV